MPPRRKPVPHRVVVQITRELLAKAGGEDVSLQAIADKAKVSVRRVRDVIEQEGDFTLNVAVGLNSGFAMLPIAEWSVERTDAGASR